MPVQCFKYWNSDPKFWDSQWKLLDNLQCFAIWTFCSLKLLIHRSALSLTMLPKMGLFCVCLFLVTQLCPTLCDSMDYSLSDSSVPRIFQARILEWSATSSSRGSFWPRDRTSCLLCLLHWQADSLPLASPALNNPPATNFILVVSIF